MAKINSRSKGLRGELNAIRVIQPVINIVYKEFGKEPPLLQRNLMQSNKGGFDIVGLDWLALEIKYQEAENLPAWWEQCKVQAHSGKEPILMFRKNHAKWKIKMFGCIPVGGSLIRTPVVIELEAFLLYVQLRLREILKNTH